jgi:membrane carboxypeptidase/penicillin-binding protein PbpC
VIQKVHLRVAHMRKNGTVFWYLDKKYLGSTRDVHVMAVSLDRGMHSLEVVDERGYSEQVEFRADLGLVKPFSVLSASGRETGRPAR